MTFKPLLIGFSLLAFAGAVQAQQPQQQQQQAHAQQQKQQGGELRVSDLKDKEVVNAKGEDIGDIGDIVIDLNSGRVHAVVLEAGGVLGIGEENYAFPPSALKPGKQDNQLVMNIDNQALENRDGFAKNQWPGMDDDYWGRVGKQSQAAAGSGSQGAKMNLVRASELMGKEVQDKSGKQAGEVHDVVVGLQQGEVQNFVISVQDGGGRAMVPARALKMSGTDDRLVLDMSADQLRSQAKQAAGASAPDRGPRPANAGRTR
jgi:sporulation protein YlmC with PRC-barrel domain